MHQERARGAARLDDLSPPELTAGAIMEIVRGQQHRSAMLGEQRVRRTGTMVCATFLRGLEGEACRRP